MRCGHRSECQRRTLATKSRGDSTSSQLLVCTPKRGLGVVSVLSGLCPADPAAPGVQAAPSVAGRAFLMGEGSNVLSCGEEGQ